MENSLDITELREGDTITPDMWEIGSNHDLNIEEDKSVKIEKVYYYEDYIDGMASGDWIDYINKDGNRDISYVDELNRQLKPKYKIVLN